MFVHQKPTPNKRLISHRMIRTLGKSRHGLMPLRVDRWLQILQLSKTRMKKSFQMESWAVSEMHVELMLSLGQFALPPPPSFGGWVFEFHWYWCVVVIFDWPWSGWLFLLCQGYQRSLWTRYEDCRQKVIWELSTAYLCGCAYHMRKNKSDLIWHVG